MTKNKRSSIKLASNTRIHACATLFIITLSIFFNLQPLPVRADEVYIDVDMEGEAYVTIENTNGSVAIVYNGRDILEELEEHYKTMSNLRSIIYALGASANIDDVKKDLENLEEVINSLVDELNNLFQDIYINIGFLLHVTGVNPGNTSIAEALASGNITIADYLDEIFINLDSLDTKISDIYSNIQILESEIKNLHIENVRMDSKYQEEFSVLRTIIDQKEQEHQQQLEALQVHIMQNQEEITMLKLRYASQIKKLMASVITAAVLIPAVYLGKQYNSKSKKKES